MEVFFCYYYFYLSWEDEYKGASEILKENEGWSGRREKKRRD